jgi:hypothetical protein
MRTCETPGCGLRTAGYSRFCGRHKATLRRHGAPDQRGVTKAELKPYVAMVRDRIARNPNSTAWAKMDARWATLVRHAEGILAGYQGGRASYIYTIRAAEEVIRLGKLVEPREVVVTAAAMFVMERMDPRRFRGDEAFRAQLVRRVRGLCEANATDYRDWATGKSRRTYHELGPRAALVMGQWLAETLGILGLRIASLEEQEREARMREQRDLHDELMDLK